MIKIKCIAAIIFSIAMMKSSYGQDPSFSQFFSSPLNINPALTANINADWRLISNFRDQWRGLAGSPYITGTISFDSKILQNKTPNSSDEDNFIGLGGMLMYDNAMIGVVKSTYASANISYNVKLAEVGDSRQRLGVGFGATYGRRHVDFSRLNFEEQFTGTGFDTNLPTGEYALSNMKPYISINVGVLYSYSTEKSSLDIGVAGFHLNKPRQTFLEDDNQRLPLRKVAHVNFETFLTEKMVLNTNAIYQFQLEAEYFSVGGSVGYYLGDIDGTLLNGGLWYWSNNAMVPYVGLVYKNFQFGLSYDITISKLNEAARKPHTWELSMILRGKVKPSGFIPCPWK
jgi:type IX secretion system PorP/SprF family membrane protein